MTEDVLALLVVHTYRSRRSREPVTPAMVRLETVVVHSERSNPRADPSCNGRGSSCLAVSVGEEERPGRRALHELCQSKFCQLWVKRNVSVLGPLAALENPYGRHIPEVEAALRE